MKSIPQNINNYIRSGFFALTAILGMQVALQEMDQSHIDNFWIVSIIVGLIFIVEIVTSAFSKVFAEKQKRLPAELGGMDTKAQLLHHLLIPLDMYIAIMLFAVFNSQPHLRLIILAFGFISFTILFTNLTAFYSHQAQLAARTHYIYDLAKLLIFFGFANGMYHLSSSGITAVTVGFISFGLLALNIYRRDQFHLESLMWITLMSMLISIISLVFLLSGKNNPLQLTLISFIGFYLASGAIHHKVAGDLNWQIIGEYLTVLALAIALLFGLL